MNDSGPIVFIITAVFSVIFMFITCEGGKSEVCNDLCVKQNHTSGRWNSTKDHCECTDVSKITIEMEMEKNE